MARQRAIERFWNFTVKSDEPDGCWLWIGRPDQDGYGRFSVNGKKHFAHRWLYQQLVAPVDKSMDLHHTCENRHCVNPSHLTPLTRIDHVHISTHHFVNKTHCIYGHPYDDANTYICPSGYRECRICRRDQQARRLSKVAA